MGTLSAALCVARELRLRALGQGPSPCFRLFASIFAFLCCRRGRKEVTPDGSPRRPRQEEMEIEEVVGVVGVQRGRGERELQRLGLTTAGAEEVLRQSPGTPSQGTRSQRRRQLPFLRPRPPMRVGSIRSLTSSSGSSGVGTPD